MMVKQYKPSYFKFEICSQNRHKECDGQFLYCFCTCDCHGKRDVPA